MNAIDSIKVIDAAMTEHRASTGRSPMHDIAIWHSLVNYYASPEDWDIVVTSTREEAFERMIADNWSDNYDYYGLDYEIIDELVLEYLKKNALAKEIEEEEDDE